MHVTKIARFDWSAVFESFWYKKLTPNRAAFYLVQVSGTSFLSMCYRYYLTAQDYNLSWCPCLGVLQSILHDVEQFQSQVKSILSAEQLNAEDIQRLLNGDIVNKLDLPEYDELRQVIIALLVLGQLSLLSLQGG